MKVLFLDVDGVLNSRSTTDFRNNLFPIDPYMSFLVGKIQLDTGCEIVLSSSWRHSQDGIKAVKAKLPILDITPRDSAGWYPGGERTRGHEIDEWLGEHPDVINYAILDDDSDMLSGQLPHFFKTTFETGLTEEIAKNVTDFLNKYKYKCIVCGKLNNYWWMYCQEHENECDREMEPEE